MIRVERCTPCNEEDIEITKLDSRSWPYEARCKKCFQKFKVGLDFSTKYWYVEELHDVTKT